MQEMSESTDINFHVFVMNKTEKGRYWKLNNSDLKFNNTIDNSGFYLCLFNKYHIRFNINLFKHISKNTYTDIILGSSWNDLNILLLTILKRLKVIKSKISFWSEANHLSLGAQNDNILKKIIRTFVLNSCDNNFLIPGKIAEETLFNYWKIKRKPIIHFPNLINNNNFKINYNELSLREKNEKKRILIVAKLLESQKGIINFLSNIIIPTGIEIMIAGDGVDKHRYIDFINNNQLNDKVFLLGNISESNLIQQYKKANFFILPSFSDPSPLSLVEACYMNLPLLISNRCGNHVELVSEGLNGYTFNPNSPQSFKDIFKRMISFSNSKLNKMGQQSYNIVEKYYSPTKVLSNFLLKVKG